MSEQNEGRITFDAPQREGKEGYIGTMFALYLKLGSIISDPNFKESDARLFYMTNLLIALIPGEKNRNKIIDDMDKQIELSIKNISGNEERAKERNKVCIKYVGRVEDFVDLHVGVDNENRMGEG